MQEKLHWSSWLVMLALLSAVANAAELRTPPFEVALESTQLTLELVLAEVEIEVQAGEQGSLRFLAGESGKPVPTVELRREGSVLWVSRAAEDPAPRTELRLRVIVGEERGLRVLGEGLRLSLTRELTEVSADQEDEIEDQDRSDEPGSEDRFGRPVPTQPNTPLEVELFGSVASLERLNQVDLRAEQSDVLVRAGLGRLDAALVASTLEVQGSGAEITVQAESSDVTVVDALGGVNLELQGSSLLASQARGTIKGQITESFVRLTEGVGQVELRGSGSTVEMRQSKFGEVQLQGTDLEFQAEDTTAKVTAELVGGSFSLKSCNGAAALSGHGGLEVKVEEWIGEFELHLNEDSRATMVDLRGLLTAQLDSATLELDQATHLALTANRSQATVRGLRRLVKMSATDSQLELDLTELRNQPALALAGASEASVELTYPCAVRLAGANSILDGRLRASGCGVDNESHGRRRFEQSAVAGGRVTRLTVELSADSRLEVESSQ